MTIVLGKNPCSKKKKNGLQFKMFQYNAYFLVVISVLECIKTFRKSSSYYKTEVNGNHSTNHTGSITHFIKQRLF